MARQTGCEGAQAGGFGKAGERAGGDRRAGGSHDRGASVKAFTHQALAKEVVASEIRGQTRRRWLFATLALGGRIRFLLDWRQELLEDLKMSRRAADVAPRFERV